MNWNTSTMSIVFYSHSLLIFVAFDCNTKTTFIIHCMHTQHTNRHKNTQSIKLFLGYDLHLNSFMLFTYVFFFSFFFFYFFSFAFLGCCYPLNKRVHITNNTLKLTGKTFCSSKWMENHTQTNDFKSFSLL